MISIHAPVKGATIPVLILGQSGSDFNPRTREGCDTFRIDWFVLRVSISIHAPVKGATVNSWIAAIRIR